jgi:hypothetical protein
MKSAEIRGAIACIKPGIIVGDGTGNNFPEQILKDNGIGHEKGAAPSCTEASVASTDWI